MLVSLDVETKCAVGCQTACEHAVDTYRNAITVVGIAWKQDDEYRTATFRDLHSLNTFLMSQFITEELDFVGFNFKFDYSTLISHGFNLGSAWQHDVSLMASVYTKKVDPDYLDQYEAKRKELNAKLPKGKGHRRTTGGSLKILAPFFIGVEPFWEATLDHDNDEYVAKDALYTLQLFEYFQDHMSDQEWTFYKDKLLPWTKLLMQMEQRGVKLDLVKMAEREKQALRSSIDIKAKLDTYWKDAYKTYYEQQIQKLADEYVPLEDAAVTKIKNPTEEKIRRVRQRYHKLYTKACEGVPQVMNLDSPAQMKWLLKEHFKLDVTDFHEEESTGKPVLKRLANEGRADIKALLDYREQKKLLTAFFPSYREMAVDGVLHCSFNPTATRTGRLSSSGPNLQQVPRGLHDLFVARPGYKLIVRDQAAVEPRLIAYMSEDPVIYSILEKGIDFHGYNTRIFFDLDCPVEEVKSRFPLQREVGKEVGLAILYGAGAIRLQESAQKRGFVWTESECRSKVKKFREEYAAVGEYQQALNLQLEAGIMLNIFGRPFRVDDPRDIHMKGLNTLIQGSASDLVLNSAYRAQKEFEEKGIDAHILLLVHDEIVLEAADKDVEAATEIIDRCMTDYKLETKWGLIKLKVEGKIGEAWEK